VLIHGPVHASWLDQIEIYFSIAQRKALTPNDFRSLAEVERRLVAFQPLQSARHALRIDLYQTRPRSAAGQAASSRATLSGRLTVRVRTSEKVYLVSRVIVEE
jgi:hypothetical protein